MGPVVRVRDAAALGAADGPAGLQQARMAGAGAVA